MAHEDHEFRSIVSWSGSTADGYEAYDRSHRAEAPPAEPVVELSSDAAFRGDPSRLNPEQLLVLSAASCQLLSFLAVAARARIDVRSYRDEGWAVMPGESRPMSIERIVLRPVIEVVEGPTEDRVQHLVHVAHEQCFIANTLAIDPEVEATVRFVPR